MIHLAIFGSPISHSRSPEIHRSFARQCGLELDYQAIEADAETLPLLLQEFAAQGGRGCNITVPLKHEAWKLAQGHSDSAKCAQAANTLLFKSVDQWHADNTDGRGLVRDLVSNTGHPLSGSRVCIIGAGGAVACILGDMLLQDPGRLVIANRTLGRARQLQERYAGLACRSALARDTNSPNSPATQLEAITLQDLHTQDSFDLVINATSLGHSGKRPPLPPSMFHSGSLCYDLNYSAAAEPLRTFCLEAEIDYRDGLGMLVEQAALSFELWTGVLPATEPVQNQLNAIRIAR